jgi:hypothetical protein
MIFKKILNFFDKSEDLIFPQDIDPGTLPQYGKLYKIENESFAFRYIYRKGDEQKGIHRFKHHQLKEYIFYDFSLIEREANREEIRVYNLIKDYINEIARKENDFNYNTSVWLK